MKSLDADELVKFHELLPQLRRNEVFVLLLIGIRDERRILDTLLIKNNSFEEFFNKVSLMYHKSQQIAYRTEVLIDINKKCVGVGLRNACPVLIDMINSKQDVRNFFSIILQHIRHAQTTHYTLIKNDDILKELDPVYVVRHKDVYYNIFDKEIPNAIQKPEIPIAGLETNGDIPRVIYVRGKT